MRRECVTLEVQDVAWLEEGGAPRQPVLRVTVEDDAATVRHRLLGEGGVVDAADVDVTFRFQEGAEAKRGVVAITDRLTGEFLLEVNAPAAEVMTFVSAARRYAERTEGDARFRVRVLAAGEAVLDLEKRTLLVYADDGELLRERSLIPSGVEI